jgi:hypothetical protein
MPNQAVQEFVANVLPKFKYALITDCILSPEPVNSDIDAGGFRGLDIRKAPFCVDAKVVYSFSGPKVFSWRQQIFPGVEEIGNSGWLGAATGRHEKTR